MKLKIKFTYWEECVMNWVVATFIFCVVVWMLVWAFTS